jgi:hypothetical protein
MVCGSSHVLLFFALGDCGFANVHTSSFALCCINFMLFFFGTGVLWSGRFHEFDAKYKQGVSAKQASSMV